MRSTLWWLGLIFGTLSLVMLIRHGLDYGFVAPLQMALEFYEKATAALAAPIEPLIAAQLSALRNYIGFELHLAPHWKHVFVLTLMFQTAMARAAWLYGNIKGRVLGAPGGAVLLMVLAPIVSLIAGVALGTVSLNSSDLWQNAAVASVPLLALPYCLLLVGFLWALVSKKHRENIGLEGLDSPLLGLLAATAFAAFVLTALVLAVVGGILSIPFVAQLQSPTLVASAGAMLALGALFFAIGFFGNIDSRYEYLWEALTQDPAFVMGSQLVGALVGAGAFLALNAGLKLAGL